MKSNTIFILINELEENQQGRMPGLIRPKITFDDLLKLNEREGVQISRDDIFIGNSARWKDIKERIEDYLQLSFLRDGALEIVYFSIYDALTQLYTNDADKYFHFYDECVQQKEMEQLVHQFPASFKCKLINRSNENVQEAIVSGQEKELESSVKSKINFNFLTISNFIPYLKLA
jgi:hypothetical protein